MTRREILSAAAGTLAAPVAGLASNLEAKPLVGPDEVLTLCLEADWLLSCREEAEHMLHMCVGETADATVTVLVNGRDCLTRGDLVRELRRLLVLVESDVPLTDPDPEPFPAVSVDLAPGTAAVKAFGYWR